jgi:hypothetical protein
LQVFYCALIAGLCLLRNLLSFGLQDLKAPLITLCLDCWVYASFRCCGRRRRLLSLQKAQHLASAVPRLNCLLNTRIALRQKRRDLVVVVPCAARSLDLGA